MDFNAQWLALAHEGFIFGCFYFLSTEIYI